MATTREAKELHLFIWKEAHSWEYVFLDEAFKNGNDFKGLTGTKFVFLTEEEVSDRIDDYDFHDLRVEAVKHNNTDDWYSDWFDSLDEREKEQCVLDDSYSGTVWLNNAMDDVNEKEDQDYEYSDCVSGGRIFDEEMLDRDFREYVDEENYKKLLELYKEYEWYQPSCARECLAWENFTS